MLIWRAGGGLDIYLTYLVQSDFGEGGQECPPQQGLGFEIKGEGGFMSLGEELERNISKAWLRLRKQILSDPQELQKRLARRRGKSLGRPPRAWCLAIRASDRRITPAHWVISPEHAMDLDHPEHPYEPIEHEVTIQTHAIRRYCHPVSFSREDAEDVAEMLGVSRGFLWSARV